MVKTHVVQDRQTGPGRLSPYRALIALSLFVWVELVEWALITAMCVLIGGSVIKRLGL